jgi:hypothetical protein
MSTPHIQPEFRINRHVERMQRYIPLDAGADQLVHELVDVEEAITIETRAENALLEGVMSPEIHLVLLTGDAGHGKTRLCCSLLERLGYDRLNAAETIRTSADGSHDLAEFPDRRQLRVIKDLSDFDPLDGAELVSIALGAERRVTVVCANEGRLRDVVSRRSDRLAKLLKRLEDGLKGDGASEDGVLVINLNFQSVAAFSGPLVGELLRRWVGDGRNWATCTGCRARPLCPIFENRRLLAESEAAERRTSRWAELLRTAERSGVVITIRELLVTVAYAITSGLRCEDVHRKVADRPVDRSWQWTHMFFEVLFDRMAALQETSPRLRMPPAMAKLDPGHFADRRIDERIDVDAGDVGFRPHDPTGDSIGMDWRDLSIDHAREDQLRLTRFLRRRAFFEDEVPGATPRVGLRFGDEFEVVVRSGSGASRRSIRDRVARGLTAVQGLVVSGEKLSVLPIVEPALAGRAAGIAILDRDVRLADVEVMSLSEAWTRRLGREPELVSQVDWVERSLAVMIEGEHIIELDLRAFELICAAGEGLDLMSADAGIARRLLLQLAALAGSAERTGRIAIIEPGQRWQIDLDIDDQLIGTRL